MYTLKLNSKECISCGICADVCEPRAIEMRICNSNTVEGKCLMYTGLNNLFNSELPPNEMMSFPLMENSLLCNGCLICVNECPTSALVICE